jgi:hypothetical protein
LEKTGSSTTSGSTPTSSTSTTTTTVGITPDTRYVPVSGDSIKPLVGCP